MKKIVVSLGMLMLIAIIVVAAIFMWRDARYNTQAVDLPPDTAFTALAKATVTVSPSVSSQTEKTKTQEPKSSSQSQYLPPSSSIPNSLNLKAAFYAQAPTGNWDYPWQEACEEASVLLIANEYFNHQWTSAQFNQQILNMVDWENKTFGDYKHTTMAQTNQLINELLNLQTKIHENPTLDSIKKILAEGHFIVLPLAGKELGNPYFSNGGPVYHVVVAKGYTKDNQIITHDVGTKRGENYVYDWATIDAALHDYAEPITNGARRIIEVFPPQL